MRIKKYYKLIRVDYTDSEYLRITNTDTVGGNFNIVVGSSVSPLPNLEYSTDGVNWTTASLTIGTTTTIEGIAPNGNIYLRGVNKSGFNKNSNSNTQTTFNMDANHTASGNIMSLVDYNNMSTLTSVPNYSFSRLFYNDTKLTSAENTNFGNVTSIGSNGCYYMFSGCAALTTAPDLSNVTSIGQNGCYYMFNGCSALTTAPDLSNVTAIGSSGCTSMFYGCSKLQTIYTPSVDTWSTSIFSGWVYGAGSSAATPKIMYTTETLSTLIPSGTSGYGNYTVTVR